MPETTCATPSTIGHRRRRALALRARPFPVAGASSKPALGGMSSSSWAGFDSSVGSGAPLLGRTACHQAGRPIAATIRGHGVMRRPYPSHRRAHERTLSLGEPVSAEDRTGTGLVQGCCVGLVVVPAALSPPAPRTRKVDAMVDRIDYDEFGLFHENAEEYGLPFDVPPVVRRVG